MYSDLREQYFKALELEGRELIDVNTGELDANKSKVIDCPICNSSIERQDVLFKKNGYTFVRCNDCDMIFTNPQVREDVLSELYSKSVANDLWVEVQKSSKEQAWKKDYYLDSAKIIEEFSSVDNVSLLDIGCGMGNFIEVVSDEKPSWILKGIDLNKKATETAVSKGLDVKCIPLSDYDEKSDVDVFTLFGVLEHLPNPKLIIEDIKKASKDGKKIKVLAVVPNAYSLYHMFIQEKSRSFDGRNHLLYFSKDTLTKLFVENGFKVLSVDTVLTGIDAIKNQMQWFDPYNNQNTDKYLPQNMSTMIKSGEMEKFIKKNDLGLRLRIIAEYTAE